MKLKVGDIEMDSHSGITFGDEVNRSPAVAEESRRIQKVRDAGEMEETSLLAHLPDWPRAVYLSMAAIALLGAIVLGRSAVLLLEAESAMWLAPMVPVLGLTFAAGVAIWRAAVGTRQPEPAIDSVDRQRSEKIAGHLTARAEPASIEELMDELAWREEAVVRGLKAGISRDLLVEDLDLDSGHWTYAAAPTAHQDQPTRHALPVEERAKLLSSDQ